MHIAVLGGGLTGLVAAFHLSRRFPAAQITLLERKKRLGGWVRSERVSVPDVSTTTLGSVVLEAGPRTLRPSSKALLELVNLLELGDSLITTRTVSPAAQNRFLKIPGSHGLTPIPTSILSVLTSPLGTTLIPAIVREPFRFPNRDPRGADESVDSFLARRFGDSFARTFGSALVHGIYAADARKLSVKAAFPTLWEAEERGKGSVIRGFLSRQGTARGDSDYDLGGVARKMAGVSVFSFQDGLGTITAAIQRNLETKPNVRVLTETTALSLVINTATRTFKLAITGQDNLYPTHVVSALPLPALEAILHPSNPLPHLTANPSSSVTVVNLVFPTAPSRPIHPPGFGYLIPRPPSDYSPDNSGFLGTVFDSCATAAQDTCPQDKIVKMTVMLGGPHPITPEHTSLTTILRCLASDLATDLPEPLVVRVHHHKNCIPTFTVGHVARMKELSDLLSNEPWCGRMEIIGAGVGGVSVGDCVQAGREVGNGWA